MDVGVYFLPITMTEAQKQLLEKQLWNDDGEYRGGSHIVQGVQKEYIKKFKELKDEYKGLKDKESKKEYLNKKKELRAEYLDKLKSVTGIQKQYSNQGDTMKAKYKDQYTSKYGAKISLMSDEQIQVIIGRIDTLLNQINTSLTYTNETKQKFNTILIALKELLQESISTESIDIDSLFE